MLIGNKTKMDGGVAGGGEAGNWRTDCMSEQIQQIGGGVGDESLG